MRSMCAGAAAALTVLAMTVLAAPAPTAAAPASGGAATASVTGADSVVVNRFVPSGTFGSTDEFVELRNTGDQLVWLDGWELVACLSPGMSRTIRFGSDDVIYSGGHLFVSHIGYAAGGGPPSDVVYGFDVPDDGGWLLYDPWSGYADGVGLREDLTCTEGDPAPQCDWSAGQAATRDEQGRDTDDNAVDFTCPPRPPGW